MTKLFMAAVGIIGGLSCLSGTVSAQDYSLALTMKLDELVEKVPAGRYRVVKTAIDAQGNATGKPLRDDHICIKRVGQVANVVLGYATTFDLSIMAWKNTGASCKSAYYGGDSNVIHETMCATTEKMAAPSRWNVLEADPSCKVTYTETGRERSCSDMTSGVIKTASSAAAVPTSAAAVPKQITTNHYMAGAILEPGKSLRLHLREFDTSATTTKYIAGHAVTATLATGACEAADRPAMSITD